MTSGVKIMRKAIKVQNWWSNIVNSCEYNNIIIVTSVVTVTWDITLICYYVNLETLCSGCKVNALISTRDEQYYDSDVCIAHIYIFIYLCTSSQ